MLNQAPLVETLLTPQEIIGWENVSAFTSHVRSYNPISKANPQMAEIIRRLHENGYYPAGIDDQGKAKFACAVRSDVQKDFEGPELEKIKRMTPEQMCQYARGGYRKIVKNMAEPFESHPWDEDFESYENQGYVRK